MSVSIWIISTAPASLYPPGPIEALSDDEIISDSTEMIYEMDEAEGTYSIDHPPSFPTKYLSTLYPALPTPQQSLKEEISSHSDP